VKAVQAFNNGETGAKEFAGQVLGASQIFETFKGVLSPVTGSLELMGYALTGIASIMGGKLALGAVPAAKTALLGLGAVLGGPVTGLIAVLTAAGTAVGLLYNALTKDSTGLKQAE
ncbi:hypothetical protein V6O07_09110, partial [Arthrospira platensis SPKY2]